MVKEVEGGREGKERKKEARPTSRPQPSAWLTERYGSETEKPREQEGRGRMMQPPPPIGGKGRADPSKKMEKGGRGEGRVVMRERGKILVGGQGGRLGIGYGKREGAGQSGGAGEGGGRGITGRARLLSVEGERSQGGGRRRRERKRDLRAMGGDTKEEVWEETMTWVA